MVIRRFLRYGEGGAGGEEPHARLGASLQGLREELFGSPAFRRWLQPNPSRDQLNPSWDRKFCKLAKRTSLRNVKVKS